MSVFYQGEVAVDSLPCQLTARGVPLDVSPQAFGELRIADHTKAGESSLREQLNTAGYLYLPGFFPREEVKQVRASVCGLLEEQAMLETGRRRRNSARALCAPGVR